MLWKGEDLREQKSLCASCDRNETPGHNKNINWGKKKKKKKQFMTTLVLLIPLRTAELTVC